MVVTNEYKRTTHESHEREAFTFLATAIEADNFYILMVNSPRTKNTKKVTKTKKK